MPVQNIFYLHLSLQLSAGILARTSLFTTPIWKVLDTLCKALHNVGNTIPSVNRKKELDTGCTNIHAALGRANERLTHKQVREERQQLHHKSCHGKIDMIK